MKVIQYAPLNPNDVWKTEPGDVLMLGEYTATCQRRVVDWEYGFAFCTFWLDQPLTDGLFTHTSAIDDTVNRVCHQDLSFAELIREYPDVSFRLPTVEDIFGWDPFYECADEDGEQWALTRIHRNRLPNVYLGKEPEDKYRATWLANETMMEKGDYATISFEGMPSFEYAGTSLYVRPKFTVAIKLPAEVPHEA